MLLMSQLTEAVSLTLQLSRPEKELPYFLLENPLISSTVVPSASSDPHTSANTVSGANVTCGNPVLGVISQPCGETFFRRLGAIRRKPGLAVTAPSTTLTSIPSLSVPPSTIDSTIGNESCVTLPSTGCVSSVSAAFSSSCSSLSDLDHPHQHRHSLRHHNHNIASVPVSLSPTPSVNLHPTTIWLLANRRMAQRRHLRNRLVALQRRRLVTGFLNRLKSRSFIRLVPDEPVHTPAHRECQMINHIRIQVEPT
ncbi:unnamed protein product [Protopolystoma xenopodis]|uniref:Uncharacterized protein n=1 Tax=Protopolystoma xenopodis TaxID=117903 RepID=A0A448WJY1_9PLAT|nr:unnamed protein product [Protopolystoma xenopodis]